eukprot:s2370_g9.t1
MRAQIELPRPAILATAHTLATCSDGLDVIRQSDQHDRLKAMRIGEASNPGPSQRTRIRLGISNPTSIISKVSTYTEICEAWQIDAMSASETSATAKAQLQFTTQIRKIFSRVHWSPPVAPHKPKSDGTPSLRGKASGVALLSRLPSREAIGTVPENWIATSRILHTVLTMGMQRVQLLTLYGLPSTQPGSADFNNNLIEQALSSSRQLNLPTVILGDFNISPFALPVGAQLQLAGFKDLVSLYSQLHGRDMPPTCRNVTTPDNALISADLQPYLAQIQVLNEPYFDTHKVVVMTFDMPPTHLHTMQLSLPQTFVHMPLDQQFLPEAYEDVCQRHGVPTSIEQWGLRIETAVDQAMRKTQAAHDQVPYAAATGLPKFCRGRCQPRHPKPYKRHTLTKQARPGDYQPFAEIYTHATSKKVKQVRRLDSICRGLRKTPFTATRAQILQQEWNAVLACQAFKGNFPKWSQNKPEIGPLPLQLPSYDLVFVIYQMVKHETTIAIRQDQQVWHRKLQYRQHVDTALQGHKRAFAQLKQAMQQPLHQLQHEHSCQAILVPEHEHLRIYADSCDLFHMEQPVHIDTTPCKIVEQDRHSLLLKPPEPATWPEEALVTQTQYHSEASGMFHLLQQYWQPYWTAQDPEIPDQDIQQLLATLPRYQISPCPLDVELWHDAIKALRPDSARGIDGISTQELKLMPSKAIEHLMHVLDSYREGFPLWLMWTRTCPIPKKAGILTAAQIRPISVMAQLYRLWSRVQCKHIMMQIHTKLPATLTGFVPGRGPYDAVYEMQWMLEQAHDRGTKRSGISIDLLKCFNTIHRPMTRLTMQKVGIPASTLNQYFGSLNKVARSWQIHGEISVPEGTSRGLPEGDPLSVLGMLMVALTWSNLITGQLPSALVSAYADNWGWTVVTPPHHTIIIQSTTQLVKAYTMQIDWSKSWLWLTHAEQLPQVKAAIRAQLGATCVTNLLHAMDLGGQMTYHGPPKLGKVQNRFNEAAVRLKRLQSMPHDVKSKTLMVKDQAWHMVYHHNQLDPQIPAPMYTALHAMDMNGHTLHFYTDGSCQHPANPNTRYSSYSVVLDVCHTDAERIAAAKLYADEGVLPNSLHVLTAARTPGEQRIHRAELYAIIWICERFCNVAIHTDSAVTLAAIRAASLDIALIHHMEDLDLIYRLKQESSDQQSELVRATYRREVLEPGAQWVAFSRFACPLLIFWAKDLATQVYFWDAYKRECRLTRTRRGKYVNPGVAEFLVGG